MAARRIDFIVSIANLKEVENQLKKGLPKDQKIKVAFELKGVKESKELNEETEKLAKQIKQLKSNLSNAHGAIGIYTSSLSNAEKKVEALTKDLKDAGIELKNYKKAVKESASAIDKVGASSSDYEKKLKSLNAELNRAKQKEKEQTEAIKKSIAEKNKAVQKSKASEEQSKKEAKAKKLAAIADSTSTEATKKSSDAKMKHVEATKAEKKAITEVLDVLKREKGIITTVNQKYIEASIYTDQLRAKKKNLSKEISRLQKLDRQTANTTSKITQLQKERTSTTYKLNDAIKQQNVLLSKNSKRMKSGSMDTQSYSKAVLTVSRRLLVWAASATVVYGAMRYLRRGLTVIKEFDKEFIEMKKVLSATNEEFDKLKISALGLAQEFGLSINEMAKSFTIFAQQGKSVAEIITLTRIAAIGANTTLMGTKDVTELLTAAINQFKIESEDALSILDKMTNVAANSAVTTKVLGDATRRAGAASAEAGLNLDQFNGIVAALGTATRYTGQQIGTSMRFIMTKIRTNKAIKAIESLGIAFQDSRGMFRNTYDVLTDLANKFPHLSDAVRSSTARAIAGTRRYNDLLIMLRNWDHVLEATIDSEESQGSALYRNEIAVQSLEKRVQKLVNTFQELAITLGESALGKGIFDTITGITNLLQGVNNLIKDVPVLSNVLLGLSMSLGASGLMRLIKVPMKPGMIGGAAAAGAAGGAVGGTTGAASGVGLAMTAAMFMPGGKGADGDAIKKAKSFKRHIAEAKVHMRKFSRTTSKALSGNLKMMSLLKVRAAGTAGMIATSFAGLGNILVKFFTSPLGLLTVLGGGIALITMKLIRTEREINEEYEKSISKMEKKTAAIRQQQRDLNKTVRMMKRMGEEVKKRVGGRLKKLEGSTAFDFGDIKIDFSEVNLMRRSISKTAEEFKKGREEVKKLDELIRGLSGIRPDFIQGFDDFGNAILKSKFNVDQLGDSLERVLRLKVFEAFDKSREKIEKLVEGIGDARDEINSLKVSSESYLKMITRIGKGKMRFPDRERIVRRGISPKKEETLRQAGEMIGEDVLGSLNRYRELLKSGKKDTEAFEIATKNLGDKGFGLLELALTRPLAEADRFIDSFSKINGEASKIDKKIEELTTTLIRYAKASPSAATELLTSKIEDVNGEMSTYGEVILKNMIKNRKAKESIGTVISQFVKLSKIKLSSKFLQDFFNFKQYKATPKDKENILKQFKKLKPVEIKFYAKSTISRTMKKIIDNIGKDISFKKGGDLLKTLEEDLMQSGKDFKGSAILTAEDYRKGLSSIAQALDQSNALFTVQIGKMKSQIRFAHKGGGVFKPAVDLPGIERQAEDVETEAMLQPTKLKAYEMKIAIAQNLKEAVKLSGLGKEIGKEVDNAAKEIRDSELRKKFKDSMKGILGLGDLIDMSPETLKKVAVFLSKTVADKSDLTAEDIFRPQKTIAKGGRKAAQYGLLSGVAAGSVAARAKMEDPTKTFAKIMEMFIKSIKTFITSAKEGANTLDDLNPVEIQRMDITKIGTTTLESFVRILKLSNDRLKDFTDRLALAGPIGVDPQRFVNQSFDGLTKVLNEFSEDAASYRDVTSNILKTYERLNNEVALTLIPIEAARAQADELARKKGGPKEQIYSRGRDIFVGKGGKEGLITKEIRDANIKAANDRIQAFKNLEEAFSLGMGDGGKKLLETDKKRYDILQQILKSQGTSFEKLYQETKRGGHRAEKIHARADFFRKSIISETQKMGAEIRDTSQQERSQFKITIEKENKAAIDAFNKNSHGIIDITKAHNSKIDKQTGNLILTIKPRLKGRITKPVESLKLEESGTVKDVEKDYIVRKSIIDTETSRKRLLSTLSEAAAVRAEARKLIGDTIKAFSEVHKGIVTDLDVSLEYKTKDLDRMSQEFIINFFKRLSKSTAPPHLKAAIAKKFIMDYGKAIPGSIPGLITTLEGSIQNAFSNAFISSANVAKDAASALEKNLRAMSAATAGIKTPEIARLKDMMVELKQEGVIIEASKEIGKLQAQVAFFGSTLKDTESIAKIFRNRLEKIVDIAAEASDYNLGAISFDVKNLIGGLKDLSDVVDYAAEEGKRIGNAIGEGATEATEVALKKDLSFAVFGGEGKAAQAFASNIVTSIGQSLRQAQMKKVMEQAFAPLKNLFGLSPEDLKMQSQKRAIEKMVSFEKEIRLQMIEDLKKAWKEADKDRREEIEKEIRILEGKFPKEKESSTKGFSTVLEKAGSLFKDKIVDSADKLKEAAIELKDATEGLKIKLTSNKSGAVVGFAGGKTGHPGQMTDKGPFGEPSMIIRVHPNETIVPAGTPKHKTLGEIESGLPRLGKDGTKKSPIGFKKGIAPIPGFQKGKDGGISFYDRTIEEATEELREKIIEEIESQHARAIDDLNIKRLVKQEDEVISKNNLLVRFHSGNLKKLGVFLKSLKKDDLLEFDNREYVEEKIKQIGKFTSYMLSDEESRNIVNRIAGENVESFSKKDDEIQIVIDSIRNMNEKLNEAYGYFISDSLEAAEALEERFKFLKYDDKGILNAIIKLNPRKALSIYEWGDEGQELLEKELLKNNPDVTFRSSMVAGSSGLIMSFAGGKVGYSGQLKDRGPFGEPSMIIRVHPNETIVPAGTPKHKTLGEIESRLPRVGTDGNKRPPLFKSGGILGFPDGKGSSTFERLSLKAYRSSEDILKEHNKKYKKESDKIISTFSQFSKQLEAIQSGMAPGTRFKPEEATTAKPEFYAFERGLEDFWGLVTTSNKAQAQSTDKLKEVMKKLSDRTEDEVSVLRSLTPGFGMGMSSEKFLKELSRGEDGGMIPEENKEEAKQVMQRISLLQQENKTLESMVQKREEMEGAVFEAAANSKELGVNSKKAAIALLDMSMGGKSASEANEKFTEAITLSKDDIEKQRNSVSLLDGDFFSLSKSLYEFIDSGEKTQRMFDRVSAQGAKFGKETEVFSEILTAEGLLIAGVLAPMADTGIAVAKLGKMAGKATVDGYQWIDSFFKNKAIFNLTREMDSFANGMGVFNRIIKKTNSTSLAALGSSTFFAMDSIKSLGIMAFDASLETARLGKEVGEIGVAALFGDFKTFTKTLTPFSFATTPQLSATELRGKKRGLIEEKKEFIGGKSLDISKITNALKGSDKDLFEAMKKGAQPLEEGELNKLILKLEKTEAKGLGDVIKGVNEFNKKQEETNKELQEIRLGMDDQSGLIGGALSGLGTSLLGGKETMQKAMLEAARTQYTSLGGKELVETMKNLNEGQKLVAKDGASFLKEGEQIVKTFRGKEIERYDLEKEEDQKKLAEEKGFKREATFKEKLSSGLGKAGEAMGTLIGTTVRESIIDGFFEAQSRGIAQVQAGQQIGRMAGGTGGMAVGTAAGGPVGGAAGQIAGELIGGFIGGVIGELLMTDAQKALLEAQKKAQLSMAAWSVVAEQAKLNLQSLSFVMSNYKEVLTTTLGDMQTAVGSLGETTTVVRQDIFGFADAFKKLDSLPIDLKGTFAKFDDDMAKAGELAFTETSGFKRAALFTGGAMLGPVGTIGGAIAGFFIDATKSPKVQAAIDFQVGFFKSLSKGLEDPFKEFRKSILESAFDLDSMIGMIQKGRTELSVFTNVIKKSSGATGKERKLGGVGINIAGFRDMLTELATAGKKETKIRLQQENQLAKAKARILKAEARAIQTRMKEADEEESIQLLGRMSEINMQLLDIQSQRAAIEEELSNKAGELSEQLLAVVASIVEATKRIDEMRTKSLDAAKGFKYVGKILKEGLGIGIGKILKGALKEEDVEKLLSPKASKGLGGGTFGLEEADVLNMMKSGGSDVLEATGRKTRNALGQVVALSSEQLMKLGNIAPELQEVLADLSEVELMIEIEKHAESLAQRYFEQLKFVSNKLIDISVVGFDSLVITAETKLTAMANSISLFNDQAQEKFQNMQDAISEYSLVAENVTRKSFGDQLAILSAGATPLEYFEAFNNAAKETFTIMKSSATGQLEASEMAKDLYGQQIQQLQKQSVLFEAQRGGIIKAINKALGTISKDIGRTISVGEGVTFEDIMAINEGLESQKGTSNTDKISGTQEELLRLTTDLFNVDSKILQAATDQLSAAEQANELLNKLREEFADWAGGPRKEQEFMRQNLLFLRNLQHSINRETGAAYLTESGIVNRISEVEFAALKAVDAGMEIASSFQDFDKIYGEKIVAGPREISTWTTQRPITNNISIEVNYDMLDSSQLTSDAAHSLAMRVRDELVRTGFNFSSQENV